MPPLCVHCQVEMACEKNDAKIIRMSFSPPAPYQIFNSDLWKCPGCGVLVISGWARKPLAEHFDDDFAAELAAAQAEAHCYYAYERLVDVPARAKGGA